MEQTFVIFTDVRLVIDNGDGANGVCAPLGSDSHGFRDFLVLLQVSAVSALPVVLSIIGDIVAFIWVFFLLPFQHQQLDLVAGYDLQCGVGV